MQPTLRAGPKEDLPMTAPSDAQARDFTIPGDLAGKRLDLALAVLAGVTRNPSTVQLFHWS